MSRVIVHRRSTFWLPTDTINTNMIDASMFDTKGLTTVAGTCDICNKKPVFGRSIRHKASGKWERRAHKTSRMFRPNIQAATLIIDGVSKRMRVCTRCLRTQVKSRV